jgi:anaphase-promoting complex subunit 11
MTSFESPCPSCKLPGDDCPPIEGNCSHFFHLHCIYKWLNSGNEKCPLDREPWSVNTL